MRLIDADKLIKDIDYSADLGGALGKVVEVVKAYAKFMVQTAPTIEQPEIIRCRNCKYWEQKIGDEYYALGDCDFLKRGLVMCEGYCAWAEPREESNES